MMVFKFINETIWIKKRKYLTAMKIHNLLIIVNVNILLNKNILHIAEIIFIYFLIILIN